MTKSIPVQEREWQAESDAQTLITAIEIEKDSARKKRALAKATKMAQEAEKRAKAARQVASRKSTNNPKPKHRTKRKTPKRKKVKK